MIELYHNDMSTCAQKVRFTLAEKNLTWESHHLDLRARDQQKPDYVKLNPNAVVPTLVHDGTVIVESNVINEYLDDAFPAPALRPDDAAIVGSTIGSSEYHRKPRYRAQARSPRQRTSF